MNVEKVIRDDMVAVLVSPGFGAGWASWHSGEHRDFLLFDRGLVEMAERKASADEAKEYLKSHGIETYTGGWSDVKVEWLPVGTAFTVDEYDGSESLQLRDATGWHFA